MKASEIDRFTIPNIQDTEPIEELVAKLRRNICSECTGLLRKARMINAASAKTSSFNLRLWESRINRILEAQANTFSIEELQQLRRDCEMLVQELRRFES